MTLHSLKIRNYVSEEVFRNTYALQSCADSAVSFLQERNLLPFTVATALTPNGRSLLNLATLVSMTGHMNDQFQLEITNSKNSFFSSSNYGFPTLDYSTELDQYRIAYDEAAYGRLLACLGAQHSVPSHLSKTLALPLSKEKDVLLGDATKIILSERLRSNPTSLLIGNMTYAQAKKDAKLLTNTLNAVTHSSDDYKLFRASGDKFSRFRLRIPAEQIERLCTAGLLEVRTL